MAKFNHHDPRPTYSEAVLSQLKDRGIGLGAAMTAVLGTAISGVATTVLVSAMSQYLQESSPELGLALKISALPAGILVGGSALAAGVDLNSRDSRIRKAFDEHQKVVDKAIRDHRKAHEDIRFHGRVDRRGFHAVALPVKMAASVAEALNKLTDGKGFTKMLSRTREIQARQEPGSNTWLVRHSTERGAGNWVERSEAEFNEIEAKLRRSKTPFIKEGLDLQTGQWVSETLIGGTPDSRVTNGPSRRSRPPTYIGGPETSYESAREEWHLDGRPVTPAEVAIIASGISEDQLATRLENTAQETKVDQCSLRDDLKSKISGATEVRLAEDYPNLMEVKFGDGPFIRAGFLSDEDVQAVLDVMPRETTVVLTHQGMAIMPDVDLGPKPTA
jgi:hypothetical protein